MNTPFRLGVVFTHPTQHHAPLWRKLNAQPGVSVSAFYLCAENQPGGRIGEGNSAAWDIDLTEGYTCEFLKNWNGKLAPDIKRGLLNPGLINRLKSKNFDAVFISSFYTYAYRLALALCKLQGIPVIMQNDATIITDRHFSYRRKLATTLLYPWMYGLVDHWISSGDHNEIYLGHYGIPKEKITRGCYPVDRDRYEQALAAHPAEIQQIRSQLAWNSDTVLYGFVGKYIERKNPFEFIDAIVEAHKKDTRIRGIMLGGGDQESAINQRLAELDGEVINVGFINQSQLPLYFAALDVFVSTSHSDPHPLVVSEAMACSCPAIISDGCGNWGYRDTVQHQHNGFVYPVGDRPALTQHILTLAEPTIRDRYSQHAKQVFNNQDLNCEVDAFLTIIDRIRQSPNAKTSHLTTTSLS